MIIGIDPDVNASGIAKLPQQSPMRNVEVFNLSLWSVFAYLIESLMATEKVSTVLIEAGWLNKKGLSFLPGRMRAVRIGMNHAIGQQIEMFCHINRINYELIKPIHKKWTHNEFITLTGARIKHTNQEQRDAASLIFYNTPEGYLR